MAYRSRTPDEAIAESLALIDAGIAAFPRGIGLIAIFHESAPTPSADGRRRISQHLVQAADSLLVGVTVIEGGSLRSMALRTATSTMTLLLRQTYPHRVCDSVQVAAEFMAPHAHDAAGPLAAQDLVRGIAELSALAGPL